MNEQMRFNLENGSVEGRHEQKERMAIERLKAFEPPEGYFHTMSYGKDSQCTYHLLKLAGCKFDSHYAVTSCDPPELIRFGRKYYPDVIWDRQYYDDGIPRHYFKDGRPKPITMWSLIADHTLPPTRKVRYCCAHLKEPGGGERVVVTGVRWAESNNRKLTHGVVGFQGKPKGTIKMADEIGADYKLNKHGEVIMNDDNDANRRMVEMCYRTRKTMVNPIVDWTEDDVWWFLNKYNIPHCELYDQGFSRLGCIGCPLSGSSNMIRDFERWPKYKELYIRAFQHMIDNHPGQIKILDPNADTKFKLDVYEENAGGGAMVSILGVLPQHDRGDALVHQGMVLKSSSDSSSQTATTKFSLYDAQREFEAAGILPVDEKLRGGTASVWQCFTDGSKRRYAESILRRWIRVVKG